MRSAQGQLTRAHAKFSAQLLRAEDHDAEAAAQHEEKQAQALAQIEAKETELSALKTQRQTQPKPIKLKDLPEAGRVAKLRSGRKQFTDTIKLIAHRSESALAGSAREKMKRHGDARSFVRGLMRTSVNLRPDIERRELRIELRGQSNPMHDRIVEHLCSELNATETPCPANLTNQK